MADLDGKTVLLTGAARGIGLATARRALDRGARVVISDRNETDLERAAEHLGVGPRRLRVRVGDVADPSDASDLVSFAIDAFGQPDHLVPLAGVYPQDAFADISDASWRRVMAINLDSVFRLVRECVPHLVVGGSIVLVTSVAGHRGSPGHAHYAASKGALLALGRSVAQEYGTSIRVNMVAPGIIRTPMTEDLVTEHSQRLIDSTPMGRFGEADEVAAVIEFLMSDAASFVTGEVVHVNGGMYMA